MTPEQMNLLHDAGWECPYLHPNANYEAWTRNGRGNPFAEPPENYVGRRNSHDPTLSGYYLEIRVYANTPNVGYAHVMQWDYQAVWHSCKEQPVENMLEEEFLAQFPLTAEGLSRLEHEASEANEYVS